MKPVKFNGVNTIYGENQEEYLPLPAFKTSEGEVVTCWELSDEDVERIVSTRRVWLLQNTFNQPLQPISMSSSPMVVMPEKDN